MRILTHCENPRRGTNLIGLALSLAKLELPNIWDLDRYEHTSLNVLADPTTPAWICKPNKITVSHPLTIPVNLPIDISVTVVDENELPVVNAVVCLNKIDDIYEIETTNTVGQATFYITANSVGLITVTASKTMYIPYQGEIQVFEFEVDIPIAHTSYSEGRKIVLKPGTEELYLSYTFLDFPGANGPDDWATYSFSPDGGSTWEEGQNIKRFTRNPSIGLTFQLSGYHPCVAYRNSYEPYLVDQPAVIYFARYDDPDWVLYTIDSFPVVGIFHPSISPPSIVIDANNICHMVYSGVLYAPGKAYVVYKRFDAFNPSTETVIIDSAIVPEDWEPSSPCIGTQLGFPHIVYDFPPEAGEPESEIWYRCLTETGWSNRVNISNSYSLPSEHPFIYLTNEKAVVVWSEEEEVGNEESREIWKGERFLNHPPEDWTIWREVETPNQASDWPIITANNNFLIWSEHIFVDTEQNWEVLLQSPPHGSESISKSPYTTQSLYPSCAWRQTTEELNLYTAFTEHYEYEPNPYIFGIRMVKNSFPGTPVPRYTIFGGDEIPSPYCIERDGYVAYDDYPVDYDTTELIYKFTDLNPDLKYKIDATVYHEFSGEWGEWIKIDNTAQHLIKYEAGEPKSVELHVPPAAYKDGEIIIKITKFRGDFAMLHLSNLYEFEKKGGGGGPQAVASVPQHLVFGFTVSPNIITRSARIQYTIPKSQKVTLKLYDVVGRKVISIIDDIVDSGIYTHYLNGVNLSQGIYFLILEGEKENKRQKILIVR